MDSSEEKFEFILKSPKEPEIVPFMTGYTKILSSSELAMQESLKPNDRSNNFQTFELQSSFVRVSLTVPSNSLDEIPPSFIPVSPPRSPPWQLSYDSDMVVGLLPSSSFLSLPTSPLSHETQQEIQQEIQQDIQQEELQYLRLKQSNRISSFEREEDNVILDSLNARLLDEDNQLVTCSTHPNFLFVKHQKNFSQTQIFRTCSCSNIVKKNRFVEWSWKDRSGKAFSQKIKARFGHPGHQAKHKGYNRSKAVDSKRTSF